MTVLIIDDSGFMRQQVRRALETGGFEVLEAADGDEGLAQLTSRPDVRVVICDVNMPNRSGIEVLEVLASDPKYPQVPVVMLTTEGQHDLIVRARALGAKGWIIKPFKAEMLLLAVQKLTTGQAPKLSSTGNEP